MSEALSLTVTNTETCPDLERLERYVEDLATDEPWRVEVERHAATCAACRETLVAFGLARPGGSEQEAAVEAMLAAPPGPALAARLGIARRSRWHLRRRILALTGAAAAALIALGAYRHVNDPVRIAAAGLERARPFEGRSSLPIAYAELRPVRGGSRAGNDAYDPVFARLLGRDLEEVGRPLAITYLWRGGDGDPERARQTLAPLAPSAEVLNDRALVEMVSGDFEAAAALLDGALRYDGGFLPALFNRALVLEKLGRADEARTAWQAYLAAAGGSEPGWVEEARAHLASPRVR